MVETNIWIIEFVNKVEKDIYIVRTSNVYGNVSKVGSVHLQAINVVDFEVI